MYDTIISIEIRIKYWIKTQYEREKKIGDEHSIIHTIDKCQGAVFFVFDNVCDNEEGIKIYTWWNMEMLPKFLELIKKGN